MHCEIVGYFSLRNIFAAIDKGPKTWGIVMTFQRCNLKAFWYNSGVLEVIHKRSVGNVCKRLLCHDRSSISSYLT